MCKNMLLMYLIILNIFLNAIQYLRSTIHVNINNNGKITRSNDKILTNQCSFEINYMKHEMTQCNLKT